MRYRVASAISVVVVAFVPALPAQSLASPSAGTTRSTALSARHVIGLENINSQKNGKLSGQNGVMEFDAGKQTIKVPAADIDDIFIGSEATQGGGKVGRVVKTAAIAAPFESGKALSLLMYTKVDLLTVAYHDEGGARHGAIFALPKGQAADLKSQLVAGGAHASDAPAPVTTAQPAAHPKGAKKPKPPKLSASAIQIEQIEAGDAAIPPEFRYAVYERLIEKIRKDGEFKKVFRSGDREAATTADLVILRTTVSRFKEGSQLRRELTTVTGGTTVDVTTTVAGRDGHVMLDSDVSGKVRFFGENLGATNDLAKRIAKILHESF